MRVVVMVGITKADIPEILAASFKTSELKTKLLTGNFSKYKEVRILDDATGLIKRKKIRSDVSIPVIQPEVKKPELPNVDKKPEPKKKKNNGSIIKNR